MQATGPGRAIHPANSINAHFGATVLKQIATEISNIKAEYRGVLSEDSIDLVAGESVRNLANSRVPQFVPVFVGRFTRDRLRELTGFRPRSRPPSTPDRPALPK